MEDRARILGDAVQLVAWIAKRRRPFSVEDIMEALPTRHKRTVYRWMIVLEGAQLVVVERGAEAKIRKGHKGFLGKTPMLWRSCVRGLEAA